MFCGVRRARVKRDSKGGLQNGQTGAPDRRMDGASSAGDADAHQGTDTDTEHSEERARDGTPIWRRLCGRAGLHSEFGADPGVFHAEL